MSDDKTKGHTALPAHRVAQFRSQVDHSRGPDACWPYTGNIGAHGYGRFNIEGFLWMAHRLAYVLHHGDIPAIGEGQHHGTVIMHICDNRRCCNPTHLIASTQDVNLADMRAKGRAGYQGSPGTKNPNASVTQEQVLSVKMLRERGLSSRAIGGQVGLCATTVAKILRGEHWASRAKEQTP